MVLKSMYSKLPNWPTAAPPRIAENLGQVRPTQAPKFIPPASSIMYLCKIAYPNTILKTNITEFKMTLEIGNMY